MIICPRCGTRNRRGSRYCYHCGQRLDIAFDVSCPACDRLNPGGSVFCAFCGTKIATSLRAESAAAEPATPGVRQPLESRPECAESAAAPRRELPPWLYEQPDAAPGGHSKYLNDIPGALPRTEGWLSSVPKPGGKPVADAMPEPKTSTHRGCLLLPLLALLGALGLALMSGL